MTNPGRDRQAQPAAYGCKVSGLCPDHAIYVVGNVFKADYEVARRQSTLGIEVLKKLAVDTR